MLGTRVGVVDSCSLAPGVCIAQRGRGRRVLVPERGNREDAMGKK